MAIEKAADTVAGCASFRMKIKVGGAVGCTNKPVISWNITMGNPADESNLAGSDIALYNSLLSTVINQAGSSLLKLSGADVSIKLLFVHHIYDIIVIILFRVYFFCCSCQMDTPTISLHGLLIILVSNQI